jgi:hypothetical protein
MPGGYINDAIAALEKNWDTLNAAQQWSARERLRAFAKSLPTLDSKELYHGWIHLGSIRIRFRNPASSSDFQAVQVKETHC